MRSMMAMMMIFCSILDRHWLSVNSIGRNEAVFGECNTLDGVSCCGDTLCRDNCQLIGMPFFHTRSAGENNHN